MVNFLYWIITIEKDWKNILADEGFEYFEEYLFFKGYIRLLKAKKKS